LAITGLEELGQDISRFKAEKSPNPKKSFFRLKVYFIMKHLFFTLFIISFVSHNSWGQKENLQDIRNKLLCNVFDYQHADMATNRFLRANFPYLTQQPPAGGWAMPPVGTNSKKEIVSMKFRQHPFFNFNLKEGRVDFHAVIMSANNKFETGADLWLIFDNEKEANTAFKVLTDTLTSVSKEKKITNGNSQMTAAFSGNGKNNSTFQVKLILKKDDTTGDYTICLPDNDD
jgi:hypothetical protein